MTATLTLYELGDQLQTVADTLVENGGELTPELAEQLAALEGAFEAKVERVLLYAKNLEGTAAAAKLEAARLSDLASGRANAADRLREYVKGEMERAKIDKVETLLIVARIQQNGRPSIRWTLPPDTLPVEFKKTTVTLDGDAAYKAWKADPAVLPEGFAVERGTHLRVR